MLRLLGARSMSGSYTRFTRQFIQRVSWHRSLCLKPKIKSFLPISQYYHPTNLIQSHPFCVEVTLDDVSYERISDETLESLTEFLEELVEEDSNLTEADVLYSTGVLTLHLGDIGTYVINKQSPNKQIWYSSPFSGPKRFDFIDGVWIYKHDGKTLHDSLSQELSKILKRNIDLSLLAYGKSEN